jgi:SAM-dependent methyltransferase
MWALKIILKIILARLPVPYSFWSSVGIFRHGSMNKYNYVERVFYKHYKRLKEFNSNIDKPVILEIGPGDSIMSTIFALENEAKLILIDDGNYTKFEKENIKKILDKCNFNNKIKKNILLAKNNQELLDICDAKFYNNGLDSIKKIESNSIDFIYSQAVLEHIRVNEVEKYITEFKRVLKIGGSMSHIIDFKDHLGGNLNNLRFPSRIWESKFASKSGFYTNRIRYSQFINLFKKSELNIKILSKEVWKNIPINRVKLAKEFKELTDSDLKVKEAHFFLF